MRMMYWLGAVLLILLAFFVYCMIAKTQDGFGSADHAIQAVQNAFAELKDYPSDHLPPKSIQTERAGDGWYVAFVQEGSGRPIISARCFVVDRNGVVGETGSYHPEALQDGTGAFSA